MVRHSPRYTPAHTANPTASGQSAQPQATTSPSRYFAPGASYPMSGYHPSTGRPFYVKASDLGVDPAYMEPSPEVSGYPYIPHNPTLAELEACTRRMRSVKTRESPKNCYRPSSGGNYPGVRADGASTGAGTTSGNQSYPGSPELADESDQSYNESEEEEESSGPETPYSLITGLWRGEARPAFVPPQTFQSVPKAPPATPIVAPVPAPNTNEEADYSSDLAAASDSSDSHSSVASTDRAFAYAAIEEIIYELNSSVLNFKMPDSLQFVAPKDGEVFPQLPYIGGNKPLIHHKHELDALLDRLDKIESHGDTQIRQKRKQAVEAVEQSRKELNRQQSMAWYNQQYEERRS